jgi:hypothetical protein
MGPVPTARTGTFRETITERVWAFPATSFPLLSALVNRAKILASYFFGNPHRGSYKKPGARPGFLVAVLFAAPLPRLQRNANGVSLLPNCAFRTLEHAADASCGRLLPRHCLERAKVALRPIATNFSSSNCHFDNLLVGTASCSTNLELDNEFVMFLSKTNKHAEFRMFSVCLHLNMLSDPADSD